MQNNRPLEHSLSDILTPDEQDRLFRAVIQRSLSGILIFQQDRIVFSNPTLQEMLGLTEDEILLTNPFDMVHPSDRSLVKQRAGQRLKGKSPPDDYEFRLITSNGKIKWVRTLATSLDFRGKPAIFANIIDIDEKKHAEELQREAQQLRSSLLDGIPHPALLISKDGIILATNRQASDLGVNIGGYCNPEFSSRIFSPNGSKTSHAAPEKAADPGSIKCSFCQADQMFKKGEPITLYALEGSGRFWDAHWIPIDANTYLHYAIDVTEHQKRAQALRESEERYRLITDTMNDGLCIQDPQGLISQVNRQFCKMTGFDRDELIGRNLTDLLAGNEQSSIPGAVLKNQRDFEGEASINRKDGRKIITSLVITPLLADDGHHRGSFAFFSDVSELKILRRHSLASNVFENIVGFEPPMRKLFEEIMEFAACDFPVLIQGESGVGKELVAQAIHNLSDRSDAIFVPVNCAALPEGLLESELFGHAKGAFTGAIRDKKGRFELAHGGTIFLDEIAELSPAMQVKLLRILQGGVFERVGGQRSRKVDVRIISATNQDLEREMNAGRFRQDLYYRLGVMPLRVPPLRERKNDIPLLADHFISAITGKTAGPKPSLSSEALILLMNYDWPGNVRELQNAIQFAFVKSRGSAIKPAHLPAAICSTASKTTRRRKRRRKLDPAAVRDALRRTAGNKLQAARLLGVNRATLYRFLAETKAG